MQFEAAAGLYSPTTGEAIEADVLKVLAEAEGRVSGLGSPRRIPQGGAHRS